MKRNLRKKKIGLVTSNKMNKTIIVSETKRVKHSTYQKPILITKKYIAHDENNICNIGDLVQLMETRPLSKSKRWRLIGIIEKVK